MTNITAPQPEGPQAHNISGWTDLWNGDLRAADRICAPAVRVRFGGTNIAAEGDRVSTAAQLAELIAAFRATRPGLVYCVVEARTTESWGYCVWNATRGDLQVGGIDTFTFERDRIGHVHSVTGQRPMSW